MRSRIALCFFAMQSCIRRGDESEYYPRETYKMNSETLNNILENHFPIPFFLINTDGELLVSNNQKGNFHMVVDYTVESLDLESIKKETNLLKAINNEHYVIKINPIVEDTFHGYLLTLFHEKDFKSSILAQTKDYQAIIEDFQTIFDNSYDVLYVTDGTGKTLRVSSACKTLWGKSPEELIGKTVFELEEDGIYNPSATIQVLDRKSVV